MPGRQARSQGFLPHLCPAKAPFSSASGGQSLDFGGNLGQPRATGGRTESAFAVTYSQALKKLQQIALVLRVPAGAEFVA